eukprot:243843-Rhodomonas_salina.2
MPGAPWHPHRGFDTVAYMKEGRGDHEDRCVRRRLLTLFSFFFLEDVALSHPDLNDVQHGKQGDAERWRLSVDDCWRYLPCLILGTQYSAADATLVLSERCSGIMHNEGTNHPGAQDVSEVLLRHV